MQPEIAPARGPEAPRRPLPGAHEPACRRLAGWLQERRGFTLLVGPEGVGKSELVRHACARLPGEFEVVFVQRPDTGEALRAALLGAAGGPGEKLEPGAGLQPIEALLRARTNCGRWTVLVIDGTEELESGGVALLDALAALEPMLQLVVVTSTPAVLERAREVGVDGVAARVRQSERLVSLTREQAAAYARELIAAGQPRLSDAAAAEIAARSQGLPDRVAALVAGAVEAARTHWLPEVTRECVEVAAGSAEPMPTSVQAPAEAAAAVGDAIHGSVGGTAPDAGGTTPGALPDAGGGPVETGGRRQSDRRRGDRRAGGASAPRVVPVAPEPATARVRRGVPDRSDPFRNGSTATAIDTPELLPVLADPHSACTEWFRVLRVRLEDWMRQRGGAPKVIAFTSPNSAAGKTVVTANLALLWAQHTSERVLLVDGDLRRPQHHALFDLPRRPGFADLLAQRVEVAEAAAFVSEVDLWVMPAGRPGNPRQLANPDLVRAALEALRAQFDVILLDAPPLVGLVDARSMAGAADGAVMVVRAGKTRFQALQRSLAFLASDNLIGTVVNAADTGVDSAYSEYRRSTRGR